MFELDEKFERTMQESLRQMLDPEYAEDQVIYAELLKKYLARYGKNIDFDLDFVPRDFRMLDSSVKITILDEALSDNKKIEETQGYAKSQEDFVEATERLL